MFPQGAKSLVKDYKQIFTKLHEKQKKRELRNQRKRTSV